MVNEPSVFKPLKFCIKVVQFLDIAVDKSNFAFWHMQQEAQMGLISLTLVFCHNLVKIHSVVIEILSFS